MAGKIFLTGDTHGADQLGLFSIDGYMPRLGTRNFSEIRKLDKDDYVIILGDFGGVWTTAETKEEKHCLDWLEDRPCSVLCVLGNHENYDRINAIPQKDWNGGKVRELRPHVLLLSSGEYYTIADHTFFVMNGAASHDVQDGILDPDDYPNMRVAVKESRRLALEGKYVRIKGYSWWPQEMPTETQLKNGEKVLQEHNNKVDFILSHSPSYTERIEIFHGRKENPANRLELWLDGIMSKVEFKKHYFGHLHCNCTIGDKSVCLYGLIERIC